MAPQAMPKRALFRQEKGPRRPFTPGSRFSSGTNTSERPISPVTEARRDSLSPIVVVEKPSKPRSTTKPRISPSSRAHTTARSAMGALVIQYLAPFSR